MRKWVYLLFFSQEENKMRDILSFCPLSEKEAGFLSSCEETPLQLSSQESFYHISFVMPRHPGVSADIDGSVSLPSQPLHACRMFWHLSAARSGAAGAPPASVGSSLCSEGSAGAAGCWHASGLDVKLIDTTWIFGDDARRKNRRPVRWQRTNMMQNRLLAFFSWRGLTFLLQLGCCALQPCKPPVTAFGTCGCLKSSVGLFRQERFTTVWKDNRFFMLLSLYDWEIMPHL